uniref:ORF-B n=1 Tax=Cyclospora cayetanensis TaxID=88456 RepID=A0A0K0NU70_9EIME|nr:ORF-B [Cyclospora cayetanensis]AKO71995.1 ORF-B [Cyclospora cayetanensis]ANJ44344.1 ORF-B [Cyclospora cayetanensis]ANN13278.1 ORF-B [Cyclospora cayetanensis]ANN13307.1 ORF-B [Cyclospora cayetanensis]ANN13336.1 ORF-B [Cyclospora cayetanensis]
MKKNLKFKKNKRLYRIYNYFKYNIILLDTIKIYLYILYYILLSSN